MQAFFEQVAEERGFAFHAYQSAEASLEYLDRERPSLLFLNIMMPQKDGYTFLRELRRHALHEDTPTVMISSKDYAQDRSAAKELGVVEFVAKPISRKAIRSLIDKYVKADSDGA